MEMPSGNVCPAMSRVIAKEYDEGAAREIRLLPHEPAMYDATNFLWPVSPDACNSRLRACRHCGALYLEPQP